MNLITVLCTKGFNWDSKYQRITGELAVTKLGMPNKLQARTSTSLCMPMTNLHWDTALTMSKTEVLMSLSKVCMILFLA
jgi:hypothetical protein